MACPVSSHPVESSHTVAQLRVMYWSLRPNAEKMRAKKLEEAESFICNTTTIKLFRKAFKTETKKYALGYGPTKKDEGEAYINVNSLLNLAIQECGVVHWIFSDSLCQALGNEKTKQFSPSGGMPVAARFLTNLGNKKHFFATLTVLCVFFLLRKEVPKKQAKSWDEVTARAYAYIYFSFLNEKRDEVRKSKTQETKSQSKDEVNSKGKDKEEVKENQKEEHEEGEADDIEVSITVEEVVGLLSMEIHNCLVASKCNKLLEGLIVYK